MRDSVSAKQRRRAGSNWKQASDYPMLPDRQITRQLLINGSRLALKLQEMPDYVAGSD